MTNVVVSWTQTESIPEVSHFMLYRGPAADTVEVVDTRKPADVLVGDHYEYTFLDVSPGETFYAVRAVCLDGESEWVTTSHTVASATDPVLTGYASTVAVSAYIYLDMPADDSVTGFDIYRGTSSGALSLYASVGYPSNPASMDNLFEWETYGDEFYFPYAWLGAGTSEVPEWTGFVLYDNDVVDGTEYFYQAVVKRDTVEGAVSNEVSVTVSEPAIPDAPVLSGYAGDGYTLLSWTEPDGNGQVIHNYVVSEDDTFTFPASGWWSPSEELTLSESQTNGVTVTRCVRARVFDPHHPLPGLADLLGAPSNIVSLTPTSGAPRSFAVNKGVWTAGEGWSSTTSIYGVELVSPVVWLSSNYSDLATTDVQYGPDVNNPLDTDHLNMVGGTSGSASSVGQPSGVLPVTFESPVATTGEEATYDETTLVQWVVVRFEVNKQGTSTLVGHLYRLARFTITDGVNTDFNNTYWYAKESFGDWFAFRPWDGSSYGSVQGWYNSGAGTIVFTAGQ